MNGEYSWNLVLSFSIFLLISHSELPRPIFMYFQWTHNASVVATSIAREVAWWRGVTFFNTLWTPSRDGLCGKCRSVFECEMDPPVSKAILSLFRGVEGGKGLIGFYRDGFFCGLVNVSLCLSVCFNLVLTCNALCPSKGSEAVRFMFFLCDGRSKVAARDEIVFVS